MNYVLKTNALCKTYKNYPALNECSIYGFIGKNGAGKTTLIRLDLRSAKTHFRRI